MSKFEEFDEKVEAFESWEERLQQYFIVRNVEENLKVAHLLTLLGAKSYGVLKTTLYPETPVGKSYNELIGILKQKFVPSTSVIVERYKFYNRKQEVNEKIVDYVSALKELTKLCKFENFLDQALRDRLVCGVQNISIQQRLLGEPETLTFQQATKLALNLEAAELQSHLVHGTVEHMNRLSEKKKSFKTKPKSSCFRCGRNHNPVQCRAVNWECFTCKKKGHTSVVCRSNRNNKIKHLETENTFEDSEEEVDDIGFLGKLGEGSKALQVNLSIQGKDCIFEIDTGASRTVVHETDFHYLCPKLKVNPVKFKLKVVSGHHVNIVGEVMVKIRYSNKSYIMPLVVIKSSNKFRPLLGRDWLNELNPNWKNVISGVEMSEIMSSPSQLVGQLSSPSQPRQSKSYRAIESMENRRSMFEGEIKNKFPKVFKDTPGSAINNYKVDLKLKDNVTPIFHRSYAMPYALKPKVEIELSRLVDEGTLTKVAHSDWASPIVVVPKKNANEIRLCVDFKRTVNTVIESSHCVLPCPQDMFSKLNNQEYFTVLDLKGAYQQLQVSESSRKFLTINTHNGLYMFNKLPYGISCAPGIFQSVMENILVGLSNTQCYLDDILITGTTLDECHENVLKCLERLEEYNVKVNSEKCKWYKQIVEYLGHSLSKEGIKPINSKLSCIKDTPVPENVTQLKSYLGLINYYAKFVPMLSSKVKPLYNLCKVNIPFQWNAECDEAFNLSKELLLSSKVLTHYDPNLPIYVTCDSSSYGVGAILSHKINEEDRPILFASGTLSKAEQKYSQIEREAVAIMFALKKFHKFIFGRHFILISDHQPLKFLFGKNKAIPTTTASRITRWAIKLSGYDYDIIYKKGTQIGNADALSRLPIDNDTKVTDSLYSFNLVSEIPINYQDISKSTKKDITLQKVIDFTQSGWPNHVNDENFKPYFVKRNELSVEKGCLIWGNRVVIPRALQGDVLKLFHEQHTGVVRTKMLIRSYCWWPNVNSDIEKVIQCCEVCQKTQNLTSSTSLLPWAQTERNFERVHIDFFHKSNYTFLILIDSKSKWLEIKLMNNGTSAKEVIIKLKEIFSVIGLANEVVSDNGPPFNSQEFIHFCLANGVKPTKSPPYHPQSNGAAERGVQTVKKALERALFFERGMIPKEVILSKLTNFLFVYRNTPSTVSGISPAQCVFKFRPRTRYDLLKPNFENTSNEKTEFIRKTKIYSVNDNVFVKDKITKTWNLGTVVKIISFNTYLVKVNNVIKYVHADMLRLANENYRCALPAIIERPATVIINRNPIISSDVVVKSVNPNTGQSSTEQNTVLPHECPSPTKLTEDLPTTRYGRIIKKPEKLDL